MSRLTPAAVVSLACVCFLAWSSDAAGKKKAAEKSDPALLLVERVLRAETAREINRRMELAETLNQHPHSSAARWQTGFVRDGDAWRSFDTPPAGELEIELLEQYRSRRDDAPRSFPGQLDLANWCRKQGLADQERAHLLAALALSSESEQPAILRRLGFSQAGDQWVSPEQQRDWGAAIRRTQASLKKWSAKLERLGEHLAGNRARREAAIAELRNLADSSAIPALELVLAGRNEETAAIAVESFKRIDGPESSLALARQSVFSDWPSIRRMATAILKERPFEDFVPALIGLMAQPTTGSFRIFHDPTQGALYYSYVIALETQDQFQVGSLQILQQVVNVRTGNSPNLADRGGFPNAAALARADVDSLRSVGDRLLPRERALEAARNRIEELNQRVISVLAEISGSDPLPDPRSWWQWWYEYTDSPPSGYKPVVVAYDDSEYDETPYLPFIPIPWMPPLNSRSSSCFAAGTRVWTETGPVPIETVVVGDRVLAQDIQSGELGYKPVLQTTANPPKELLTLRCGDETIVCTKGHRFWISGTGWKMARELEQQALLHTATGNIPVWSVKPAPAAKTYNLVVDGFHTYFVGKTAILCQDLRRSDGANCLVPGLRREELASRGVK